MSKSFALQVAKVKGKIVDVLMDDVPDHQQASKLARYNRLGFSQLFILLNEQGYDIEINLFRTQDDVGSLSFTIK